MAAPADQVCPTSIRIDGTAASGTTQPRVLATIADLAAAADGGSSKRARSRANTNGAAGARRRLSASPTQPGLAVQVSAQGHASAALLETPLANCTGLYFTSHSCISDVPLAEPQVFNPYNSPYALPFPASAQPSAVATAPNVSYPESNSSGVMALAHATTNFGLRFSGDDQLSGPETY